MTENDTETETNDTGRCQHDDCEQDLANVGTVKVTTGGKEFCCTEHLLGDSNKKSLDEDGNVIEHGRGPMPSKSGNDITVTIPLFDCPYCTNESERVAREYGEWVHHICGMEVPDHIAETANEELERGRYDRGFVEHEARSLAQTTIPQLEERNERDVDEETNRGDE